MSTNPNFGFGVGGWGQGRYGNPAIENQPLGYYTALLTSEYQQCPNLMAWLTSVLRPLGDASNCLGNFIAAFDLDGAVGVQLDLIGQLVGASRTVPFQPAGGVSPTLDDTTYRLYLRAKIAMNFWTGTIDSLQATWQVLFPGGRIVIEDAQNMTATIILSGAFSSIVQDLIVNGFIVPRPEGVQYTFVFGTLPALGFDQQNTFIAGFDTGHFT